MSALPSHFRMLTQNMPLTRRAGAFALVNVGVYWYPCRTIRTPLEGEPDEYTIKIWEGCDEFIDNEDLQQLGRCIAAHTYIVPHEVLRDAMMCDVQARRGMPVSS